MLRQQMSFHREDKNLAGVGAQHGAHSFHESVYFPPGGGAG